MRRIKIWLVVLALLAGGVFALDRFLPEQAARLGIQAERMRAQLEEKTLTIPGFTVAYLEGGQGAPLVLVHGIGANKDNFTPVARELTAHFRVIAIDLPGFGASSKPMDADYGIDAQVQRLDQILQALNLNHAHLGGSSMGGWVVARYAAKYPNKVGSLWLLAPAGVEGGKVSEVRKAYVERGEYLLFAQTREDYERILDTVFVKRPFIPNSVIHVLSEQAIANYPLHTRIFRGFFERWEQERVNERIRGLPIPTLIVFGEQDRAIDPSDGPIWKSLLPRSELELMPNTGHLPMLEKPELVAERYLQFREKLHR